MHCETELQESKCKETVTSRRDKYSRKGSPPAPQLAEGCLIPTNDWALGASVRDFLDSNPSGDNKLAPQGMSRSRSAD